MVLVEDKIAGYVSWSADSHGRRGYCWNVGVVIVPEYRNSGVGRDAMGAVCDYLFEHTLVERIQGYVHPDNVPQQRAVESLGSTKEGVVRAAEFNNGAWQDLILYSLLRGDRQEVATCRKRGTGG